MGSHPKKEEYPNMPEAIKEIAWQQIAENSATALSLRAIARELGITAPAIYNYFHRRDDLVTALIVDAFTSLGESQRNAIQKIADDDLRARVIALGLAYREWATTYPQRYQLIFGTPIPGYEAPEEITLPAATQSLIPLLETIQAISSAGWLRVDLIAPLTPSLAAMLYAWSEATGGTDMEALYIALIFWSRVHGLVSLEIGNQLPGFITDPGEVFRRELANMIIQYFEK